MSTLLNTVETYQSLQPFGNVEELNENTIEIRNQFADQLTPSTINVLDVLHRYACKYPGVSFLSKSKIAEMLEISRRTVIRACKALEDLGIITQHELMRHNGDKRQSSNAIVFVNVTPSCHTKEALTNTHLNSSNTLDTSKLELSTEKEVVKDYLTSDEIKEDLKRGLRDKMPTYIYDILSPYFNLDELYEAYGTLVRAKASVDNTITFESNQGLYTDAVLSVISAYKRGKVRNLFAVLFTAVKDTTAQIYRKDSYVVVDWLNWE